MEHATADGRSHSAVPSPPRLEAVSMTKRFGPLVALDDVSLTLEPGTFHALLGENGAGKSTLVKCIMGYYRADTGSLLVNGKSCRVASPRAAHDLGIGMVYQHFTLVPNMSVAENLLLSRSHLPSIVRWGAEQRAMEAFLATMPFSVDLSAPVAALSAGEKQKLEILKQLYIDSRILIFDEPTSVLTPGEADEILGLLKRMTRANKLSVLMITHKLREVERLCRRGNGVASRQGVRQGSRCRTIRARSHTDDGRHDHPSETGGTPTPPRAACSPQVLQPVRRR